MESSRFELNKLDWQKIGTNAVIFLAPALLIFLISLQGGSDLPDALDILKLYILNVVIDTLRKWIAGHAN